MVDSQQSPRKGIADALLAAFLFALSAPAGKKLLQDVSTQMLAGLLYLGSGIGVGTVALVQGRRRGQYEASIKLSDLPVLAGAIGVGGVAAPLLLLVGLQHTPASVASLLLNLETVFTALLAWIVFRESVNPRIVLGMVAIVCGGLILSFTGTSVVTGWIGPAGIAAACFCWGIDNNLTQKMSMRDPLQIAASKGLVAGAMNFGIAVVLRSSWPSWPALASSLLLGVLSYGASLVFYIRALRALGTSRTGNYFSLAPFVGAVISIVVWREPLTLSLGFAGALMGVGLWLHLTERHGHRHVHEPLDHEHMHVHDEHHQHMHRPEDPPGEPHSHPHHHDRLEHSHEHYPDIHHRHDHNDRDHQRP